LAGWAYLIMTIRVPSGMSASMPAGRERHVGNKLCITAVESC
jgi:hypothetical protein